MVFVYFFIREILIATIEMSAATTVASGKNLITNKLISSWLWSLANDK